MNKKEQRALENRIRDVMEEPAELTSDEIAKIRERAYLAYQQKNENEKHAAQKKRKKSGHLRHAVAVFAIAIGLIVVSVVYSVLAPVSVSNANNFVRRAAIWVNDQLHLGIVFPVSEEANVINTEQNYFSSLKEASESLNMPITYIKNMNGFTYNGLETISDVDDSFILFVHYLCEDGDIDISIERFREDEIVDITPFDPIELSTPIGNIFVWHAETAYRAIAFYNDYVIEIYGHTSEKTFFEACTALSVIN